MLNAPLNLLATALCLMASGGAAAAARSADVKPKYYFKISNIICQDTAIITMAKELLETEVA